MEAICRCGQPANPDKTLLGCTSPDCGKWLHLECLIDEALTKTYERLGKDTPHKSATSPTKHLKEEDGVKRPLSPKEPVAGATQQTIDVNSDGLPPTPPAAASKENAKQEAPADDDDTKTGGTISSAVDAKVLVRRSKQRTKEEQSKPYLGLFDATILPNAAPPTIEIRDLRDNVDGGEKSWVESLSCIVCGKAIN